MLNILTHLTNADFCLHKSYHAVTWYMQEPWALKWIFSKKLRWEKVILWYCGKCDRFVEAGGNFIDTADCYSRGAAEEVSSSSSFIRVVNLNHNHANTEHHLHRRQTFWFWLIGALCQYDVDHLHGPAGRVLVEKAWEKQHSFGDQAWNLQQTRRSQQSRPLQVTLKTLQSKSKFIFLVRQNILRSVEESLSPYIMNFVLFGEL